VARLRLPALEQADAVGERLDAPVWVFNLALCFLGVSGQPCKCSRFRAGMIAIAPACARQDTPCAPPSPISSMGIQAMYFQDDPS